MNAKVKLLIVESPGKIPKIKHILGEGWLVLPTLGHVLDLPQRELGIDIAHEFTPRFQELPGKKDVIDRIKKAAKDAEIVYLATDPDREGEAIAYHVRQLLPKKARTVRIAFNQITEAAILEAIATPRDIYTELVEAQITRRVFDRLAGYEVSPPLQRALGHKGLSAGRVQSAALNKVVVRQREREAFQPRTYYTLYAQLEHQRETFWARLAQPSRLATRNERDFAQQALPTAPEWWIEQAESVEELAYPSPPFTTSTLQQEASRALALAPDATMAAAQKLYEEGLITYMRTDSARIAPEAQLAAQQAILNLLDPAAKPDKPPQYHSRAGSQEAHEAIRPTDPAVHPRYLNAGEKPLADAEGQLYDLIFRRFIASQCAPAKYLATTARIRCGRRDNPLPYRFVARARALTFTSFQELYQETVEDEPADEETGVKNYKLPSLAIGDALDYCALQIFERQTKPPQAYTPARLIAGMEAAGIGRPSTYAQTIATLTNRGYVTLEKRQLRPTSLGEQVNDWLVQNFPDAFSVETTASMERDLDLITTGQQTRLAAVSRFDAQKLRPALNRLNAAFQASQATGETCEQCSRPLLRKSGKHGAFLGCSGYPDCKNTRPITASATPAGPGSTVPQPTQGHRP